MAGARIQIKRGTAANWVAANSVLFSGEIGYETDTKKFKIGDGTTTWNALSYTSIPLPLSTLNDLGDVTITSVADGDFLRWNGTAWINDAVNLSTDTIGSYVQNLVAGTGVSLTNNSGEGATPTIAIGQNVATSSSVQFAAVTAPLIGNSSTSTTLETARTISLSGDVSGSVSFNGSSDVNISATIQPNSVALGTDTTGNYMADVAGGTGVSITHTPGEGSSASIAIGQDVSTSASVTFGKVTISGDLTVNGTTTTLNTENLAVEDNIVVLNSNVTGSPTTNAGIEIERGTSNNVQLRWNETTDSWEVTEDGTTYKNIAIGQDVETSSSVTFANVTAPVSGNATTASTLQTAREISLAGDVSGSASFDGSQNITITATVQPNSVALGSDTTGDYVQNLTAGTGVSLTNNSGEGASPTVTIGQDVATSASVTFAAVTAPVVGNASTASTLQTPRTISLSGDVSGSVSFNGSSNVDISATIQPNSVALGTDTTGNYVNDLTGGTGVTITHTPGEGSSPTVAIGQAVGTSSSVTFAHVSAPITGNVTGDLTGNAGTATALQTSRTINLGGDLSGSASFNGTSDVTISATVQPNSVALGADTTGNYMSGVTAGTGVTVTHTPSEGSSAIIEIGQAVGTSDNVTFAGVTADNIKVGVTGANEIDTVSGNLTIDSAGGTVTVDDNLVVSGDLTVNGTTTTLNTETLAIEDNIVVLNSNVTGSPTVNAGIEVERGDSANVSVRWNESTDNWELTEDGSTYKNIAIGQDVETSSSVTFAHVSAPVTGNVLGNLTGNVTGNADTATTLQNPRTISLSGDVSGSVSFNGSADVNISATIQSNSVALGTDTTGNYIASTDAVDGMHVRYIPFADVASYAGEYNNGASYAIGAIVSTGVGSPYGTSGQLFVRVSNPGNPGYPPGSASWSVYSHETSPSEGCLAVFAVDDTIMQVRVADVSDTEISYLNGVTSAIQTQIDTKAPIDSPTFTGTVTLPDNTVSLGTKTTGDYVSSLVAGTGVTITNNSGETATPTVAIGQNVSTSASVTFVSVQAAFTGNLNGNAETATRLQTTRTIELSGDVVGSVTFDGTNNVNISSAIQPNSVALGTDTTGDYVSSLVAGTGVTVSNNSGETATPTIAIGQSVATSASVSFAQVTTSEEVVAGTNLVAGGQYVKLNQTQSASPLLSASVSVERGTQPDVAIRWNELLDVWEFTNDGIQFEEVGSGGGLIVSATEPDDPDEGTLWFDSTTFDTFVYYGSVWIQQNTPPSQIADLGDLTDVLVLDAEPNDVLAYNGTEWETTSLTELLNANLSTKTANYVLVIGDASKTIEMNVSTANTVTIPLHSSVPFDIGTEISVLQYGVGKTQIVGSAGVTIRSGSGNYISTQYSWARLVKRATNEWYVYGELSSS